MRFLQIVVVYLQIVVHLQIVVVYLQIVVVPQGKYSLCQVVNCQIITVLNMYIYTFVFMHLNIKHD